ncbi:hypothetical protein [Sphingosinicella sp. LY1275]|uniref:hypothetical protein n=1 Tax=Sphingosinicella sp. LY1275 TaxID=3095379 RepID=UPI002ADEA657|nr:hypothetical protein [Sphingosinicella sp. LY1275]MEA1014842.1 hypothetical protein [Sphingosinicella sp. LY1275]
MFRSLIAVLALAAPAAVATAQTEAPSPWALEVTPGGCLVHAAAPSGTVVSVWGSADNDSIRFLIQNRQWNAFEDGGRYDIQVSFDGRSAWPMQAVARRNLDADGPGLTFAVSPSAPAGGTGFLEQFAGARGMHIARDGQRIDSLKLAGSDTAMTALAQCLSTIWSATAAAPEESSEEPVVEEAAGATPI